MALDAPALENFEHYVDYATPSTQLFFAKVYDGDAFCGGEPDECFARLRRARADVTCHTIEGAGHWIPYERPTQFNAVLDRIVGSAGVPPVSDPTAESAPAPPVLASTAPPEAPTPEPGRPPLPGPPPMPEKTRRQE